MPIDICIPDNNEDELLAQASKLGYDSVIFLYPFRSRGEILVKKKQFPNVKIGTYLKPKKTADVKKLQALYLDSDLIAVSTQDENTVRFAASNPFVDVIFAITNTAGKEHLEYRRSNLNAIIVNIMKDSKNTYGLSFSHLLSFPHNLRGKVIGRELQNIRLARRKIPVVIASFAQFPEQMRLPENLSAIGRVFGLNHPQSKAAVSTAIENILKRKEHRRSKSFIRPGVKLVE